MHGQSEEVIFGCIVIDKYWSSHIYWYKERKQILSYNEVIRIENCMWSTKQCISNQDDKKMIRNQAKIMQTEVKLCWINVTIVIK